MPPERLFHDLLGLGLRWEVTESCFEHERGTVVLHLRETSALWPSLRCPKCGGHAFCYDHPKELVWRHLNVFEHRCELHCRLPRARCRGCAHTWLVRPPWEGLSTHFTKGFEAFALLLMREMPMTKVAEVTGETDTRLWRAGVMLSLFLASMEGTVVATAMPTIVAQLGGLYRGLEGSISGLDRELAYWLARTPGALLTSISGIGITLAAGWMAELGPPQQWRAVRRICSYAGVVTKTKQTGGPEKEPMPSYVQQRCNKRLKNVVLQAVEKVRQYGPEDLRRSAEELEANGSHTEFGMAKRLVRLAKYLVVTGTIYRPKTLLDPDTPKEKLVLYYQTAWDKLRLKWKGKSDLKDVFAPAHPLGQWRQMVKELYALELRLPQQRAAPTPGAATP